MTEKSTFVQTGTIELSVGEDAKKAFDLKFSKPGITVNGTFYSWTGLKIAAGQLMAEGKLTGTPITEGEKAGKTAIALDAAGLKLVTGHVDAHREANPRPERGKRSERTERKPDPRNSLKNRLRGAYTALRTMQEKAENGGWGVDFSGFLNALEEIETKARPLLIAEKVDAEAIEAIHKEMDEQEAAVRRFEETDVLQDRIAAAERCLEELKGSISANEQAQLRARLDAVIEKAKAGDAEGARKGLYGDRDEGKDGLFAAFARVRGVDDAKTRELRRRGRGQGAPHQSRPRNPAVVGDALRRAGVSVPTPRDSRR